tara:strand:+ start:75 stop:620 length:546 start_codon:yes stop_codon:yes gene_type:complete
MTKAIDDAADMPKEIYIEKNGTTIHGEKVIPPFSAHTYSTNPLNGKEYTKYTRATPPQPKDVQGALDAFHLQIAEYRATKKVHNTNKYDQSIRHYQTAITALMQCQGWRDPKLLCPQDNDKAILLVLGKPVLAVFKKNDVIGYWYPDIETKEYIGHYSDHHIEGWLPMSFLPTPPETTEEV